MRVVKPGRASQQAQWTGGGFPAEWTAQLPTAVTIGGRVRDEEDRPITGATVHVIGVTRDQVGQLIPVEYDRVLTDASGKWTSGLVPEGFEGLSLRLTHPRFMPTEYDQAADAGVTGNIVTADALMEARAAMVMPPAIRLAGTVTDGRKQPIASANVLLATGENWENRERSQTDGEGRFTFFLFEVGVVQLVVQAQGHAPQQQPVEVRPGLHPLTFTLARGATLNGRVLDEEGDPVPGAEVSAGIWRELPLLDWRIQTDLEGRFRWDSAPSDRITLMVSRAGFNTTGQETSGSPDEEVTVSWSA